MKGALFVLLLLGVVFSAPSKDPQRWKFVESRDDKGWALLGKYCVGYTKQSSVNQIAAVVNLDIKNQESLETQNMTILIYDSEPDSYPSLTDQLTCDAKIAKAKDYYKEPIFTVHFNKITGLWRMPTIQILEKAEPRTWYLVLATCHNKKMDDRVFAVTYDLEWTPLSVYDNGMGPNQCVDHGVVMASGRVGLIVSLCIFILLTVVLGFYVRAQRNNLKAGRGMRVENKPSDGGF